MTETQPELAAPEGAIEVPPASGPKPREPRHLGLTHQVWSTLGSMVAVAGFLGGIFWGIWEYRAQNEAERGARTLELVDRWEAQGTRASYQALATALAKVEVDEADLISAKSSAEKTAHLRKRISDIVLRDPARRQDYDEVVYFFNRLGLCVQGDICSGKVAELFFDHTVQQFWLNFHEEIAAQSESLPDYATGLALLQARFSRGD